MSFSTELESSRLEGSFELVDVFPAEHPEVQLLLRVVAKARKMSPKATVAKALQRIKATQRVKARCVFENCRSAPKNGRTCSRHLGRGMCILETCKKPRQNGYNMCKAHVLETQCAIRGCDNERVIGQFCRKHDMRAIDPNGECLSFDCPGFPIRDGPCVRCVDELPCRFEGCSRVPYGDGLCVEHLMPLCTHEKCLDAAVDRIAPYRCERHKKQKK
jgi:hypothetical protein